MGGRTCAQTNRFASHRFIHVHYLVEQGTVTAEFARASCRIYAELMQAQLEFVEREEDVPATTAWSSNKACTLSAPGSAR